MSSTKYLEISEIRAFADRGDQPLQLDVSSMWKSCQWKIKSPFKFV